MSQRTSAEIRIAAPAAEVAYVVGQLERYPEWTTGMGTPVIQDTDGSGRPLRAAFDISAGPISDHVTLGYQWAEDHVSWDLLEANNLKTLHGRYSWRPDGEQTVVTYELEIELNAPLPSLVMKMAEQTIIRTALSGLKRQVEQ